MATQLKAPSGENEVGEVTRKYGITASTLPPSVGHLRCIEINAWRIGSYDS